MSTPDFDLLPQQNPHEFSFKRLLLLAISVFLCGSLISCSSDEVLNPPLPVTSESLVRGRELVEGLGSCGFCHSIDGRVGSSLSGGRTFVDPDGEVRGANITLASTGLRTWKESDVMHSFREYVRPDGSEISKYFHLGFEWLSDSDVSAITAYLRTLPAVEKEVPHRSDDFLPNPSKLLSSSRVVKGYVPAVQPKYPAAYGQYLADHVARCGACHNARATLLTGEEYWAGGTEITIDGETKVAPNITASKDAGIGDWSERDVKGFLATGKLPDGRQVDPAFCPVGFYRNASDADLGALVAYIRTVLPVE